MQDDSILQFVTGPISLVAFAIWVVFSLKLDLSRLPETPAAAWLQSINERQRQPL